MGIEVIDHGLADRRLTGTKLRVAKGVLALTQVANIEAFTDYDHGPARFLNLVIHLVGNFWQAQAGFGHVDQKRHFPVWIGQTGGSRDIAYLAAHGLHHQDRVCSRRAAVLFVGILDQRGPVSGHTAISRCVVDDLEFCVAHVIVDGLGHAGRDQLIAALGSQLTDLVRGVHRIVTADVEQVADVMGSEHVDDTVKVLRPVGFELVAAGTDCSSRWGVSQQGDFVAVLGTKVQQLFAQNAFDAMVTGIDSPKRVWIGQAGFDDAAQGVVDDRGRSAGLGNNDIPWFAHRRASHFSHQTSSLNEPLNSDSPAILAIVWRITSRVLL